MYALPSIMKITIMKTHKQNASHIIDIPNTMTVLIFLIIHQCSPLDYELLKSKYHVTAMFVTRHPI